MNNNISVCMITKNEEKYIEQAIRSVKDFVQEIIVIDHESDDLTVEIAEKAGASVYTRQWNGSFADARNYSLMKATSPFVLIMDADETFESDMESLQEACILMRSKPYTASRVEINNIIDEGSTSTWITRLFPNQPGFQYKGRIHEQLLYEGSVIPTWDVPIQLKHYGYHSDQIKDKDKINRNIELLLEELMDSPSDAYIMFQLGRTYEQSHAWDMALKYYSSAVNELDTLESPEYPIYYSSLLLHINKCHVKLKNWNQFIKKIQIALEIYPDYTDLYYMYGTGIIEARNIEWFHSIPQIFERCLELGEADGRKYETSRGVGTYKAHYNLGLYYELIGNLELAISHYSKSHELGFDQAYKRITAIKK